MYWRFLHIEMQDLHTPNYQKRTRKNLAEVDLQGFAWSIGESNPCSATDIGATAHWAARFLSVEAGTDDISATGSHQCQPLSNANVAR